MQDDETSGRQQFSYPYLEEIVKLGYTRMEDGGEFGRGVPEDLLNKGTSSFPECQKRMFCRMASHGKRRRPAQKVGDDEEEEDEDEFDKGGEMNSVQSTLRFIAEW